MKLENIEEIYCAFLDILGFKEIIKDWENALELYEDVINIYETSIALTNIQREQFRSPTDESNGNEDRGKESNINFKFMSDSIIITSDSLGDILFFFARFQWLCFIKGYWLRGGLAYGKHVENFQDENYFVVSEALADAATAEGKMASYPRIVIHPNTIKKIEPDALTSLMMNYSNYFIQSDDDIWFVNPFIFETEPESKHFGRIIWDEIKKHTVSKIQNKYLDLADLHNFLNSLGAIWKDPKIYYESPEKFFEILRRCEEERNIEEIIPTWEVRENYKTFYLPSSYEIRSYMLTKDWGETSFFQKTFEENKKRSLGDFYSRRR